MRILNIAGYQFISLSQLEDIRQLFLDQCHAQHLKGTILLSEEGININLSGMENNVVHFMQFLKNDNRFAAICFHQTYSETPSFKKLKIKIKKEIITFRIPEANPLQERAPSVTPEQLKQWLDEKRDIILLDTRNDYEVDLGSFTGAKRLPLKHFTDFKDALNEIDKDKTIVPFCTGGIRCEKAALLMLKNGFSNVYQLDGGILGYFAKVGNAHFEGECFVFDERVSIKPL